jgi:hypothetical protein
MGNITSNKRIEPTTNQAIDDKYFSEEYGYYSQELDLEYWLIEKHAPIFKAWNYEISQYEETWVMARRIRIFFMYVFHEILHDKKLHEDSVKDLWLGYLPNPEYLSTNKTVVDDCMNYFIEEAEQIIQIKQENQNHKDEIFQFLSNKTEVPITSKKALNKTFRRKASVIIMYLKSQGWRQEGEVKVQQIENFCFPDNHLFKLIPPNLVEDAGSKKFHHYYCKNCIEHKVNSKGIATYECLGHESSGNKKD